jgi:hypothetical protein
VNDTPAVEALWHIIKNEITAGVSFTLLLNKAWINLLSSLYSLGS